MHDLVCYSTRRISILEKPMRPRIISLLIATNLTQAALAQNPTLLSSFTNPAPSIGDGFGYSVAAGGSGRVLIGAYREANVGAAYLFSSTGTLLSTFTNPTPGADDNFGNSLAAVGNDRVIIGAYHDETKASDAGAAYLFSAAGLLLKSYFSPRPAAGDQFGCAVAALGNDRVVIGAYYNNIGTGAAYLFGTNGTLLTTFTNPMPAQFDFFGYAVASVGNDRVLIGAHQDDTAALKAGAAYLFSTNGALLTTFTNHTPKVNQRLGYSVAALGSHRVLIGTPYDSNVAVGDGPWCAETHLIPCKAAA